MYHKQLLKTLYAPLRELGYKKVDEYTWVLKFDEFSIASTIVQREEPHRFDLILGIVFDLIEKEFSVKNYRRELRRIETTLYDLLLSLGEPAEHLNKLFYNNTNEPAEGELKNNIPAIMDLFKKKIIPYFENWNDYYWLLENFQKRIIKETFYVCGPGDFLSFFLNQFEIQQWITENF